MKRIKILERQIRFNRIMYAKGTPILSDRLYDELEDELRNLHPDSLLLKQVGSLPKRRKITLPFILGGLDKAGVGNVLAWMKKQSDDILMSWKVDGGSIYAEWRKGSLEMLSTRGDGEIGEDIMFKAHKINNLPRHIPTNRRVCAKGEAILKILPKGYKTKRNAATGIINRDDNIGMNKIYIYFHELIVCENLPEKEEQRFELMEKLGLTVVPNLLLRRDELDEKQVTFLTNLLKDKAKLNIDIDGLVLSKNKHNRENTKIPKLKIAFKIPQDAVATKVTGLEWNVSRTGRIVPIVHIDKIETQGVEIKHPTGHNFRWVMERKIDKGARIEVMRSGDVIPYIKSVLRKASKFTFPKYCPICEDVTEIKGVDLLCVNNKCPGRSIAQIEYFVKILGAENIAFATLKKLYEEKIVRSLEDFYMMKKSDLVNVKGLGDISADTIIEERYKTLKTTPAKLLAAFGIPLVGLTMAKKITDHFQQRNNNLFTFRLNPNVMHNTLITIEGIGPNIADSFIENFYSLEDIFMFLKKRGLKFIKEKTTNNLKGKSFQFTGTMAKSRDEMELLTMNNGGRLSGVNKKLDYLVVADKTTVSTKAAKARTLGVKIITEEKFMKIIGG